ncbi:MAG: dihydroorotase [Chitinophagaceae bacterium]
MKIILKKIQVQDKWSKHHNNVVDLFIKNGIIESISNEISTDADFVFDGSGLSVSNGWIDIFSNFCSPGFEHKESLETGVNAAVAGGFTQVFVLPNTNPTISTQSQVSYIVEKSNQLPITVHPLGAISKKVEGNELAEMYDMQNSGAIAFTDGINPVQSASLLLKALQYVKAFDGIIIQMPIDGSFSKLGLINEGIISTQLGLPGIPAFAENLMIKREIELLKYTQSKLHITGVSTAEGIELINSAKQQGLAITCSVAPHHFLFCDEDLVDYDTNLKVNPTLRTRQDMLAIRQALTDGKIDCIASHHFPQHTDDKVCEFEYAKNGMISLQTVFTTLNTVIPNISTDSKIDLLSNNARSIFNLPSSTISVGSKAELTIFSREATSTLTKENNKSKSINSPLFNQQQKGKVVGIFCKGQLHLN